MPEPEWDVVVVGAGTSGCPLAARLADAGRRVLLLEVGADHARPEDFPADLRDAGERAAEDGRLRSVVSPGRTGRRRGSPSSGAPRRGPGPRPAPGPRPVLGPRPVPGPRAVPGPRPAPVAGAAVADADRTAASRPAGTGRPPPRTG